MKKSSLICFLLFLYSISPLVNGDLSTYNSDNNIIEIETLIVDNQTEYENVSLQLNTQDSSFLILNAELVGSFQNLQEEINLSAAQQYGFSDNSSLRFDEVISESRCPSDVLCITAGEVWVLLTYRKESGETYKFGLSLAAGVDGISHEIAGVDFILLDVTPYPVSTVPLEDSDYQITISISNQD